MDENDRIIIRRRLRDKQTGAPEEDGRVFRASGAGARWLTYLLLIPVFIGMAVLAVFFFTAFLALFAVVAAGLGLRLWWLRRKLRQAREAEQGEYVIIEDAEIVEERTDGANETDPHDRQ